MDKELRKRLEEAAENFLLPYEKLYHPAIHLGFMQGAEYGYKEAIAQAREWLLELKGNNLFIVKQ